VFDPSVVNVRMGGTVTWTWASDGHSVTDTTGLGLYDSGVLDSGATFPYTFEAASKYDYASTPDPGMTGTVKVPMRAHPTTGNTQTVFKITWAVAPPPPGMDYVVKERHEDGPWAMARVGTSESFRKQLPLAGTWEFRARIELTTSPHLDLGRD
jgi:hypothetical protein